MRVSGLYGCLSVGLRFAWWGEDDDDLSLGRSIDIARGQFGEATGHSLFKRLADLADHRRVAIPQNLRHRAKAVREARAAFVEDQRRPHRRDFAPRIAARLGPGRKESDEEKPVGRKPGPSQPSYGRAGPRHGRPETPPPPGHHP